MLVGVDGHMLRSVIGENPFDVGHPSDPPYIPYEQAQTDHGFQKPEQ